MKKSKYMLIGIFVFAIFTFINVYAGTAYTEKVDVIANINEDGSMTVTENINWDIDGYFNGVYRDILYKGENELNSATKLVFNSVTVNGQDFKFSKQELTNGESGGYNVLNVENGYKLKIFRPSEDEELETKITYTVYDVVVNYKDVSELYWTFIGTSWNGIHDLTIRINLPKDSDSIRIFAHGPLTGTSEIVNKKSVLLTAKNLNAGEGVDARFLFNTGLIKSTKNVEEEKLSEILAKEETLAIEANKLREQAKAMMYISVVSLIVAIILPIITYKKEKKKIYKAKFDGKYYRELPEDYGPAIMNKVLSPMVHTTNSQDMLATLLDLVRRKYVEIETEYKDETRKKVKDYVLKLVNKDLNDLNAQEKHFVQKMIFDKSDNISLKELKKKNTHNQEKAYKELLNWEDKIEKVAIEKDVIKEKAGIGKSTLKIVLPSLIIVAVILINAMSMNYSDIIGMCFGAGMTCIIENIILGSKIAAMKKRTEKGIEHEKMWKAFKAFLLDFSKLDERDHKSIVIWEHYLVYATGLGVAKQVLKELKIVYPTEFNDSQDMFTNYMIYSMIANDNTFDSFTSSFNSAASQAFSAPSSSSGSGGGFSGGFGGGGGRRRRSRWLLKIIKREQIF